MFHHLQQESCKMAWELLTGPFGLEPSRLYVTYFGGDTELNLEADFLTRDIWRQLGSVLLSFVILSLVIWSLYVFFAIFQFQS